MTSAAETIRGSLEQTAAAIAEQHFAAHAAALARYGAVGRQRCLEDARFHLQYLAMAVEAESQSMFLDYVAWTKVLLLRRNVPEHDLAQNLAILEDSVPDGFARKIVRAAIDALPEMSSEIPSVLDPRDPLWPVASAYLSALLRGQRREAGEVVLRALDSGTSVRDVYRYVFEPVQQEIGRLWQLNQISVAQEHFCTAVTQQTMAQLYGRLFAGEKQERRAVAMCVGGELHEIGLRIITDLLELDGWQTWYLGASVPPAAAAQLCVDHKANVLLVSATLPPHIAAVTEVIRTFRSRPELSQAKIVVGGRAFRHAPDLWRTIGADGFATGIDECVELLDQLVPS